MAIEISSIFQIGGTINALQRICDFHEGQKLLTEAFHG